MDSEGLWADVRRVVLRGDVLGLAIAVLVGTALFNFLYSVVNYIVIPLARGLFREQSDYYGSGASTSLYFVYHGYEVPWGSTLAMLLTLALAVLVVLALRRRLFSHDEESDLDELEFADSSDWRKCPECLSDIPRAARRCSFCTAPVQPVQGEERQGQAP